MFTISFSSLLLLGLSAVAEARVQFLGIAIAGGDFGCQIDGTCPTGSAQLPLSSLGGADGQGQMKHFVQDDGLNLFRLPTSWQFLINSNSAASGTLDATNAGKYDQLVQACLATGAYCMIDLHNFARFNGGIVGQGGGPSDDTFVALWAALAGKYASQARVVFEITNEPHDLDVGLWAQTCQKVVAAIRGAGAATQLILLPGTNFDSAATLVSSGSADALLNVTNPDGSTTGLLLDVHKYLDVDNSGTHAACVTDNVGNFSTVATYLRARGRQGLVSETGASSQASCLTDFCAQNAFINDNADVFVGYVGWAAGAFDPSYVLSLTPTKKGSCYVDNTLMTQCVLGPYRNASTAVPPGPSAPASTAAAAATAGTAATTAIIAATAATAATETASTAAAGTTSAEDVDTTLITAESASASAYESVRWSGGNTTLAEATETGLRQVTATASGLSTVQTASAVRAVRVVKNIVLGVVVGAALL